MWVNEGKFMDNGNCGFVLKPPRLLGNDVSFEAEKHRSRRTVVALQVDVRGLGGWANFFYRY
jgi:hypothetical protein